MYLLKIICMKVENITFLDSLNCRPFALRKLPEAFGLESSKVVVPALFQHAQKPRPSWPHTRRVILRRAWHESL
jgi:hypothetical protein